ncbi:MAG: SDR family oxidoreductase [Saprospiraceae bacterium]
MKSIVITGGTKGIGRAIADLFAAEGDFRIIVCSRNSEDLAQMEIDLKAINPRTEIITQKVDMSNKSEVLAFGDTILKHGNVDILVNNAGVFIPGELANEEDGSLEKMIETNLYSAYHLTRKLVPSMKENKSGHIFNMCSVASFMAYPNGGSYSISKFALLGFSKVLREEMKPFHIKVTSIMPGATWSNSWAGVDLPESRLMQASDIAKMVWAAYNLSDAAVMEDIVLRPQLGDL